MKSTISRLLVAGLAVAALASCTQNTNPAPAASAQALAPVLPKAKSVAVMFGNVELVRYFDAETGIVCYVDNRGSSGPSCLKVTDNKKAYTDL
jgi:archaellum component FlaG (FlaF/FlaG flagellin family)